MSVKTSVTFSLENKFILLYIINSYFVNLYFFIKLKLIKYKCA